MFTLDDQFGRTHREAEVFGDGPVVVLAGAQRQAPDAMRRWEHALRTRVPEGTRIIGLSNFKRLPFFVPKGVVTKGLAEQLPNIPVLCDWKGEVYVDLGFPAGAVMSGGVPITADLDDILVIRSDPQHALVIPVDLQKMLDHGDSSDNVLLREDDIVIVNPKLAIIAIIGLLPKCIGLAFELRYVLARLDRKHRTDPSDAALTPLPEIADVTR